MTERSVSDIILQLIDRTIRTLYTMGGRRLLHLFGIEEMVKNIYSMVLTMAANDIQRIRIGDVSASFRVSSPFEFDLFYNEGYNDEIVVLQDVLSRLNPDDVFYDVGAHIGIYSILVADVLKNGQSIAFEPNPENEQRLQENADLNNEYIKTYQYALSDVPERAELSVQGAAAEATGSLVAPKDSTDSTISVDAVPGDKLIDREEIPPPDILKIDVEGAEKDVIRGLQSTLKYESCRLVYCECHPDALAERGSSPSDVVNLLDELGFDVQTIHMRNKQPFLRAEKKEQ